LDSGKYGYPSFPSFYSKYLFLNLISDLKFGTNYGVAYSQDVNFFYYYTRLLTAIQGALIPVVAWLIGKQFKKFDFSLPAAFLFTFYPPFIVHSHYITVDIPLTLYLMFVLFFCLIYLRTGKLLWLILGCLFVSIAAMEKYPGILAFGIVLVTVGIRSVSEQGGKRCVNWGYFFKTILLSLFVTLLFISLIASPLFLNTDMVIKQIQQEARTTHLGADGLGWGGNLLYYLGLFRTSAGLLVSILAILGIGLTIAQRDPTFLLLFFGVGYWIALSRLGLHWERWSLPMMISPLLLAGLAVTKILIAIRSHKLLRWLFIISVSLSALFYAENGFSKSIFMNWQDTRIEALEDFSELGIEQKNSVSEGYTPLIPRSPVRIFDFDMQNPGEKQFVILSSNMYMRFEAEPDRYQSENAFYRALRERATLIKVYAPDYKPLDPLGQVKVIVDYFQNLLGGTNSTYRTGPTIQIYQLPK